MKSVVPPKYRLPRSQHFTHIFAAVMVMCTLPSASVYAADDLTLQAAIRAAQTHDKTYLSQQTLSDKAQALRQQAKSLWRPQVMATASVGKSNHQTKVAGAQFAQSTLGSYSGAQFNTDIHKGNAQQWAVSAKQPLFSFSRVAQGRQLKSAAQLTELQLAGEEQAMIVRISELYFAAQLAQQKMQLLSAQVQSTKKFAEEAKFRYDIGNRPITEHYEAQAQLAQHQAQLHAAEADIQVKLLRLQDAIGHIPASLPNSLNLKSQLPELADLNSWLNKAKEHNIELKMHNLMVQTAHAKSSEYALGASASLDLVGQISRQKLTGDGDFGPASNQERSGAVALQLTVPLYTGGYNSAKHQEAQAELKKSQLDFAAAQERTAQSVQSAWLGAHSAQLQIQALQAALKAGQLQLSATRTGQEVGHRTVLDVLNAQNQNTSIKIQLEEAKQNYVLSRLKLSALVYDLNTKRIHQWLNALMDN